MSRCNVTANIEHRTLAVYACHGPASRGRFLDEQEHQSPTSRTPFQRDRDHLQPVRNSYEQPRRRN